MLTHYRTAHKIPRRMAQIIFLGSLLIFPSPCFSQVASGWTSTSIKVLVISNLIVMPGYVNDSDKMDVVLDTGAAANILMPRRALELNLHSTMNGQAEGIAKGQDETMHISSGAHLAWGNDRKLMLDKQYIAALPIDYISQQTGQGADAIFGSSLFEHFQVRVDYEHCEVTFTSGSAPSASGTPIPITLYQDIPYVEATFETATGEKVPARFLVDSGTTGALILSRKFLEAHPSITKSHSFVNTQPTKAVGGSIGMELLRITGLDLGPFHIAAPVAYVPNDVAGALDNNGIAGFIGAGMLSRFTVDWDYARKTMTLTPNHHYGDPFEADASGLRMIAEGPDWKVIRVVAVSPGEPADEAGLKAGDVLNFVDGKIPPPLDELKELLTHPGSSVSVTILRSGKQSTMTIHLRRLV